MTWRAVVCLGLTGLGALPLMIRHHVAVLAQDGARPRLSVKPVEDFEITGAGEHVRWQQGDAPPASGGWPRVRLAIQDALLQHRHSIVSFRSP